LYAHEKAVKRLKRDNTFLIERIQLFAEIFKEMGCGQEAEIEVDRLEKSRIKNAWQKIEGEIIPITGGDKLFGFDIIETPGHARACTITRCFRRRSIYRTLGHQCSNGNEYCT